MVVAFDGMDKDLIEDFGLANVRQSEYGNLENKDDVSRVITHELFASFVTGQPSKEHVVSARRFDSKLLNRFEAWAQGYRALRKFKGLRAQLYSIIPFEAFSRHSVHEERVQQDTIFDKFEGSRSMFVPSVDRRWLWDLEVQMEPMQQGFGKGECLNFYKERSFEPKLTQLYSELENDIVSPRSLLMVHLHRPDYDHHLYHDPELGVRNKDWLENTYRKLDSQAGRIKETALQNGYDVVIFLSDHGLPTVKEHNENAFYSCNKELFGDKTPHITDFHDKILEVTDSN